MSKKYKVVYNRTDCIGAAACVAMHEKRWVMSKEDDRADLIGGTKVKDDPETWEIEFEDDELAQFKESAYVCPVAVIEIFDVETGEKII